MGNIDRLMSRMFPHRWYAVVIVVMVSVLIQILKEYLPNEGTIGHAILTTIVLIVLIPAMFTILSFPLEPSKGQFSYSADDSWWENTLVKVIRFIIYVSMIAMIICTLYLLGDAWLSIKAA